MKIIGKCSLCSGDVVCDNNRIVCIDCQAIVASLPVFNMVKQNDDNTALDKTVVYHSIGKHNPQDIVRYPEIHDRIQDLDANNER